MSAKCRCSNKGKVLLKTHYLSTAMPWWFKTTDGHVYTGNALKTSPGIMRVDVREDRTGCDVVWSNETFLSQSLPRLSTATGLLYFYTFQKQSTGDVFGGWYLTAVNWETGLPVWDRLIGKRHWLNDRRIIECHRTCGLGTQPRCLCWHSHRCRYGERRAPVTRPIAGATRPVESLELNQLGGRGSTV